MRVQRDQKILGISAWDLRYVCRSMYGRDVDLNYIETLLSRYGKVPTIVKGLIKEKFMSKKEVDGKTLYRLGINGISLAHANFRRYTREYADKKVDELLKRIKEVEENEYFVVRVDTAIIFGSYLEDVPNVGDIDVALSMEYKYGFNLDDDLDFVMADVINAKINGKRFKDFEEELDYPFLLVRRYLSNKNPIFSFHKIDDLCIAKKTKIIYGEITKEKVKDRIISLYPEIEYNIKDVCEVLGLK